MKAIQSKNGRQLPRSVNVGQYLITSRGKLRFKGTRVSVHTVLMLLAKGHTFKQILARWPGLERKAIGEAVELAAAALVLQTGARPWRFEDDDALHCLLKGKPIPSWKLDKRKKPIPVGKYLIVHPRFCFGRLTFEGTRIPIEIALTFLSLGGSINYVLRSWPYLKREAIIEAIELARDALEERFAVHAKVSDGSVHPRRTTEPSGFTTRPSEVD
jgi:uncharacterized protein (DUF433 family)